MAVNVSAVSYGRITWTGDKNYALSSNDRLYMGFGITHDDLSWVINGYQGGYPCTAYWMHPSYFEYNGNDMRLDMNAVILDDNEGSVQNKISTIAFKTTFDVASLVYYGLGGSSINLAMWDRVMKRGEPSSGGWWDSVSEAVGDKMMTTILSYYSAGFAWTLLKGVGTSIPSNVQPGVEEFWTTAGDDYQKNIKFEQGISKGMDADLRHAMRIDMEVGLTNGYQYYYSHLFYFLKANTSPPNGGRCYGYSGGGGGGPMGPTGP